MTKPASFISKAKKKVRYGMLLHSFLSHLKHVGIVIYPYYLDREQLIAAADLQVSIEPKLDALTTSFLSADECESVMSPIEKARAEEGYTARKRIADGCLCFGVKKEQKVIAYTWCDLKVCNHEPLPISLESSEAYLFDMYTFEECRGKNIAPFMRHKLYSHLIEMGRTDFFSVTDAFNSASKRFKGKLGAYPLKLFLYIKFGKLFERNFLLKSYE